VVLRSCKCFRAYEEQYLESILDVEAGFTGTDASGMLTFGGHTHRPQNHVMGIFSANHLIHVIQIDPLIELAHVTGQGV
jgi:hypothetical protein